MESCAPSAPAEESSRPVSPDPAGSWPGLGREDVLTGVLVISGMPSRSRSAVERAMYECLRTQSEFVVPGDDPLTAQWCTRWTRDAPDWSELVGSRASRPTGGLGCHQVLTGTAAEFSALDSAVGELARAGGFRAAVRVY